MSRHREAFILALTSPLVVRDHSGQQLAYVHIEDEAWPTIDRQVQDETQRITANVAKLQELLRKPEAYASKEGASLN
jgi:hypothetical protein